ncbi:hypothetical protein PZ897_12435 [Hoeflea sp. YIM 152468]|uniref:hypothetical protein n=1 Tax=Hoeflea sp. YIM 152468 TaxID=3031759 RepID=UPI0023DA6673|nr:hypothetical protein [Hoeflea sp. YIM 152468]MDF1608985.1 hypothetical protein [Hoeflea sp. YIM 152468]
MQRDIEAQRQAELGSNQGPSFFLAHGLERPRSRPDGAANRTPLVVPKLEVARRSEQKLSAAAGRAAETIAKVLIPHGLQVYRGDRAVTRAIAQNNLVHLCETTVCYIPYITSTGNGRLVVKMTNFASGIAVATRDGIHYRDVMPMLNTAMERNMFRILGVHTDSDGRVVGIDPKFTANGIAWSVENLKALTDACKRKVAC